MNADFHYYVTYIAARRAGFSNAESLTVARAAQYVDVSDPSYVKAELLGGVDSPTATTETAAQMLMKNVSTKPRELAETRAIWTSFHFLPGNAVDDPGRREYAGATRWALRKIHADEMDDFRLVCQPNSQLAEKMIVETASHAREPWFLHLVGIRMHVLADTWAHRCFAGVPSWWLNEVKGDPRWTGRGEKIDFAHTLSIKGVVPSVPFTCTPLAPSCDSYNYLGHGRMGHVPDLPCARYAFEPQWAGGSVRKDNPAEFMSAFKQMVAAMRYLIGVRDGNASSFSCRNPWEPVDVGGKALLDLLAEKFELNSVKPESYRIEDAHKVWAGLCKRESGVASDFPEFEEKTWLEAAMRLNNQTAGHVAGEDYYWFNKAAAHHRFFVQSEIS